MTAIPSVQNSKEITARLLYPEHIRSLPAKVLTTVHTEQLPGHGTVYMGQTLKFLAPVRPGDMVRAEVEVIGIDYGKRRVQLDCRCLVDGKKVLIGEATVLAPTGKFD